MMRLKYRIRHKWIMMEPVTKSSLDQEVRLGSFFCRVGNLLLRLSCVIEELKFVDKPEKLYDLVVWGR